MNRNLLKLIVACGAACFIACTAPQKAETEKWSERMARSEMKRFPEPWMIEKDKSNPVRGVYPRTCCKVYAGRMETYRRQHLL